MSRILYADIVTAFDEKAIGTRVVWPAKFLMHLTEAVNAYNFDNASDPTPGQAVLELPEDCFRFVSSGVGKRTHNPEDYVIRRYRKSVGLYLNRRLAEPLTSLKCVVYTRAAYLRDPDVVKDVKEFDRIRNSDCTHVLVAILTNAGSRETYSYTRFVNNLAGGNRDFDPENLTVEGIIDLAKKVVSYNNDYMTVAD